MLLLTSKPLSIIIIILTLASLGNFQSCMDNYQFYDYNLNVCVACPVNCLTCYDSTACTACVSEYYLDIDSTCAQCKFGCSVCIDANSCNTCISGLYVNGDGDCIPCAIGVQSCTIALIQSCKPGYFMLGNICAGCLANCDQCSDFVTCNLCSQGYYVDPVLSSCAPCSSNCGVCQDSTICTSCYQGYILNGGTCSTPNCTNISPFCQKCSNAICEECSFGKYVNANGSCSQGASLLCLSATGPYHTNCQTNLYDCPAYAQVQFDLVTGNQLPVCLPLLSSQNQEYKYMYFQYTSCPVPSVSSCSSSYSKIYNFVTLKSYYLLEYYISLRVYSSQLINFVVSYLDPLSNNVTEFSLHNINISTQLNQNLKDNICYNCTYGYTIINGSMRVSGGKNTTYLQLKSLNSLFVVNQIMVKASICKVTRCSSCSTAIDCIECQDPYYLQLIQCVTECDPGFYKYQRSCVLTCPTDAYPIQSSYQCSRCLSPCQTCASQTSCLSCVDGYFLDGSSCVKTCSSPQLFTNLTSKVCQTCPNPCTECSVTITNNNQTNKTDWVVSCSGCGVGYLLQQGNCTYICPLGTFSNYFNNKTQCSSCLTGCSQCSITENICQSCSTTYLLYGSTCFVNYTCPLGYYDDLMKNSCQKCHYPCLTCSVISTNCTSCIKGALYNSTCPFICPSSMFIDYFQNSQICKSCISPCIECISLSICLSCINGTFLFEGHCSSVCPLQTYYPQVSNNTCVACIPPCLTCLSDTKCLSCTTGYVDLYIYKCTLQCNLTSYPDQNFVCQLCPYPCIRCYSAVACTMCALPNVFYNQSCISVQQCQNLNRYVQYYLNYSDPNLGHESGTCSQCTYPCASCSNSPIVCLSCATGYLIVTDLSICVQQCPQSYYQNSTVLPYKCQKCDTNCLKCNITATNCLSCGTSMYLYANNTCVLKCPSGYYGSNQQQLCKACSPPCLECYNVYLCKSCASGIYYNKACVSSCPDGSLHNMTTNVCDQCTNNCLTCSILTSNCTECPSNGFYFYQNQCITTCPPLFYGNDLSHNCQACYQPCKECSSATQCTNCISGYYLIQSTGRCTNVCPDGFYADTSTYKCVQCNLTLCRTCSVSANNCTQCAIGYFYNFYTLTCVQVCPTGTYADQFYLECRQCQYPCIICNSTSCISCASSYKLYADNCYTQCPIGLYSTSNNTCQQCAPLCDICSNQAICQKCVDGYYVNSTFSCVSQCQYGYYNGYDVLSSYAICSACPSSCLSCVQTYNCTTCIPNYFLFNGLCVTSCPSLYFSSNSSTNNICKPCPQFCNLCADEQSCSECVNSFIYQNQCFVQCPPHTFGFNEQICINCTSPCLQCTSEFSCLTCIAGHFYFQDYCLSQCPDDIWKYPENMSCASSCPYNKYSQKMYCYVNGCGGMLVHLNGYCFDQCPNGYYVDQNQNCVSCDFSSEAESICKKPFKGDLQMLRSYNLRACIYFNEPISYQKVNTSQIVTVFYDKTEQLKIIEYNPINIVIDENMIIIEYAYRAMQLCMVQIKIPYVVSGWSKQSITNNYFKINLNEYNNYQYQSVSVSSRLLEYDMTQFDGRYKPNGIINAIAIALVSGTFVCLLINIVCKAAHYRQLLDFLQFVAATIYLQIQYPPILEQYLNNLRISIFSFFPQMIKFSPYAFSPSKFIEYNNDSSTLRSQGLLLIIFIVLLLISAILIIVNRNKPQLRTVKNIVKRIKYRNITDLFSIVSLPLLIFSFRFVSSHPADIFVSVLVILLVIGFVILASYKLMTAKTLQEIAGLAGELEQTENILGHMYTPFTFIRKIIFGLVLCIQPEKPISTLTLLLIFTILIMVCLFFYQPFENQITDFICISLEICLVIYVIILMILGLNIIDGIAGHYVAIFAAAFTILGAIVGLIWLIYLTYNGILKYKKQRQEDEQKQTQEEGEGEGVQSQIAPSHLNRTSFNANSIKISSKDYKQSEYAQNDDNDRRQEQDSAVGLTKQHRVGKNKQQRMSRSRISRNSRFKQQIHIEDDSEANGEQFRHWKNSSQSDDKSQSQQSRAPKYLLKMQKNPSKDEE